MKKSFLKILFLLVYFTQLFSMQIPNKEFYSTTYRCIYKLTFNSLSPKINLDQESEKFHKDIHKLVNDIASSYSDLMVEYADVVCPFQKEGKPALIDSIEIIILKNKIHNYCITIDHKPCFNSIDDLSEEGEERLEKFIFKLNAIVTKYRNPLILDIILKHKELILPTEPKITIDLILYIDNEYIQKMIEISENIQ